MSNSRTLMELKPALDGFAGIPAETRLLFSALQRLPKTFQVDGLLQPVTHPTAPRKPTVPMPLPTAEEVYETARQIGFFAPTPPSTGLVRIRRLFEKYIFVRNILWRAHREQTVKTSPFQARRFENFIWTEFFQKTLTKDDFERVTSAGFQFLPVPKDHMYLAGMRGITQFHRGKFLSVDTEGYDFFLAQTPFPGRVSAKTKLLVRYHDSVPLLMPHTIENQGDHRDAHFFALRQNLADDAEIICISEATRAGLLSVMPEAEDKCHVIHNMAQDCFHPEVTLAGDVWRIFLNRLVDLDAASALEKLTTEQENAAQGEAPRYLFCVSTLEPRKNYETLIRAWEKLKATSSQSLRLVIAGGDGWKSEALNTIIDPWVQRGEIIRLTGVPSEELRTLYQHAALTVCPSYEEGFGYAGVEAMRSGGVVIASDIAVHREIYGDGAIYFDPYDRESLSNLIRKMLASEGERESLRHKGAKNAERYKRDYLLEKWRLHFERLSGAASI